MDLIRISAGFMLFRLKGRWKGIMGVINMARELDIDISECIACGNCEAVCPAVFKLNEDFGYAEIIDPDGASEEELQEAMNYCPVSCIYWK